VPQSCFADRLGDLVELTPSERIALGRLEERERVLRRNMTLQRENDRAGEMFVLRKGKMMSSVLLDDGSRQILRFHFAGDLLAMTNMIYSSATETITALGDCVVAPFDRSVLSDLMLAQPRIAALILICNQIERAALTDRLAALGRTSAKARVAAILLEIRNRMQLLDRSTPGSFILGLTQEEIGDATGLTAVHVNRMLRQLEEEKIIFREAGRIRFLDEPRMARAANYVDRYAGLNLGWLPGHP
jgi:CRP/FNR family transcriptional regulator